MNNDDNSTDCYRVLPIKRTRVGHKRKHKAISDTGTALKELKIAWGCQGHCRLKGTTSNSRQHKQVAKVKTRSLEAGITMGCGWVRVYREAKI